MIFKYKIKLEDGRTIQGEIEGSDEKSVIDFLSKEGIILSLKKKKEFFLKTLPIKKKVKPKDLIIFTRQLAIMLSANVPLIRALEILTIQTDNLALKKVINEITDETKGGVKLSTALAKFPKIFNPFFISIIKSGETVGKLDEVLNYLADEQEKDYEIKSKMSGALIYPLFVIGVVIIVVILMMTIVIPQLSSIILETGAKLPLSTKILIKVSNFFALYWWAVVVFFGTIFFFFKKFTKKGKGKKIWDRIQLRIPIIGEIFQKIYLIQFSRNLSTLISGGVVLPEALKVVNEIIPNTVYKELIEATIKEVNEGRSVATFFSQSKEIPQMLSQMLVVGEQAGQVDVVLNKIANFYTRELEILISKLTSLIEPIIIIFLGIGVAFVVSGIILPIYNLASGSF